MIINDFLYFLDNAANRLQAQANACRGTVCDDEKTHGLQLEADTVREAAKILRLARENIGSSNMKKDGLIYRNPAPHAAAPLAPSGEFREFTVGPTVR